jgi:predicted subunit of tRNA(5-methylaminomethyl-2-thiouridylate) methyltransferase
MADTDKTLKLRIEADDAASPKIKNVSDESERYQATLQAMADKARGATDGTTALNSAVREYAESVKSAKAEMESSGGAFVPDNLADKLKQVGEDAHKGSEGVEHFNLHGREMYHLAGMLNRILPGSGEALKAFGHQADGGALALIGITTALEIVIHSFEELTRNAKAADEALAAIVDEKYDTAAVEGVAKAWNEATAAQEVYRRSLAERHEDDNDPSKGLADRALRSARDYQSAQQQISEAQKKLGEASIEEMEKQGLISHQEALKQKLQLDFEYEQRRLALAKATDEAELKIKRDTAEIVKEQVASATTNENAAAQKSAAADASKAHIQTEIEKTKQDQAARMRC